jgi:hypothetical protein
MSVLDHLPIIEEIAKRLDFKDWGNLCLVSRKCARCFRESEWIKMTIKQIKSVRFASGNLKAIENQTEQACIEAIRKWGDIHYVKNPTETMYIELVKRSPLNIIYVGKQTLNICMETVKRCGVYILRCEYVTEEMYIEAYINYFKKHGGFDRLQKKCPEFGYLLNDYGLILKNVKNQTEDICIYCVKENGLDLKHVRIQTERICIEAVKQNGLALIHVREQTLKICEEAYNQNSKSLVCMLKEFKYQIHNTKNKRLKI